MKNSETLAGPPSRMGHPPGISSEFSITRKCDFKLGLSTNQNMLKMLILCLERICRRPICAGPLQTGAEGTAQVESGAPGRHEAEKQESQRGIIYWARNERLT